MSESKLTEVEELRDDIRILKKKIDYLLTRTWFQRLINEDEFVLWLSEDTKKGRFSKPS